MINPQPGATIAEQLAARLRQRITSGEFRPGQIIPSERSLAQELGIGRETASRAIKMLRAEGLLEHHRGKGMFVREQPAPADLSPPKGSTAVVRMPSAQERADLGLTDGIPVIVITEPSGTTTIHPADRLSLRW